MRQGTFRAILIVFGAWNADIFLKVVEGIPVGIRREQNWLLVVQALLYPAGVLALTVACILLYKHANSKRGLTILCGSVAMTMAAGALAHGMFYGLILAYFHVVVLVVTLLRRAHLNHDETGVTHNGNSLAEHEETAALADHVVDRWRDAGTLHTEESSRSKLSER